MIIYFANSQTIPPVNGLQYSLSGAYASIYRVASGNNSAFKSIQKQDEAKELQIYEH